MAKLESTDDEARFDQMRITVGICTYGRPHLAETLLSISNQKLPPNCCLDVIVADNSSPPTSKIIVDDVRTKTALEIEYLVAPPFNISTARNAILDATKTEWLAFIDDDEIAPANWICELVDQAKATKGDAIFGPVQALYDDNSAAWIKKGDFHSTDITFVSGQILTGYTCNVLMRLSSPSYSGLRFLPELGKTGGEDTVFFSILHKRGAVLSYAPNALIYEPVPVDRANFKWLLKRRFRSGQTHARLTPSISTISRLQLIFSAFAKTVFCLLMAFSLCCFSVTFRRWVLRGSLHFGVLMGLFGLSDLQIYK